MYGKEHDGDQVAPKTGTEDADCGRANQISSSASEFEHCSGGSERATCSPLTVSRIEKGTPTVAIGIYLRVLYALQLEEDILWLAKEDKLGRVLQDLSLKTRERASKK